MHYVENAVFTAVCISLWKPTFAILVCSTLYNQIVWPNVTLLCRTVSLNLQLQCSMPIPQLCFITYLCIFLVSKARETCKLILNLIQIKAGVCCQNKLKVVHITITGIRRVTYLTGERICYLSIVIECVDYFRHQPKRDMGSTHDLFHSPTVILIPWDYPLLQVLWYSRSHGLEAVSMLQSQGALHLVTVFACTKYYKQELQKLVFTNLCKQLYHPANFLQVKRKYSLTRAPKFTTFSTVCSGGVFQNVSEKQEGWQGHECWDELWGL